MYRLAFCGLDGPAASFNHKVRYAGGAAMQAVVVGGQWVTIFTGRSYQLLEPFLPSVVVHAPPICCNSGLTVEPDTRRILVVQPMDLSLSHDIIRSSRLRKALMARK